jgi:hypothetical protein
MGNCVQIGTNIGKLIQINLKSGAIVVMQRNPAPNTSLLLKGSEGTMESEE